jgi:deoxyribonuclease V
MGAIGMKPSFSVKKAHETQLRLAKQIICEDKLPKKIRFVAGVDVAYVRGTSIGAVAVLDYDSLKLVESQIALCKTGFPYIPTLLSFREVPPTVLSIKRLQAQPDVLLVDGHGFAHPYRCGFASHLGLVVHRPTIGVAKGRLFGEVGSVEAEKDVDFLKHDGEVIGAVVTTKYGCEPVYVSVGHMVSLETAIKIVKHCARHDRIPEPVLKAHEIATREKRKINISSTTNNRQ